MAKHKDNTCDICKEWDGGYIYRGDVEIAKHNLLIHENRDDTLPDKEFEELS